MKKILYDFPKSSFLSLEKDMSQIIDKILENKRIQKLLYYDTKNALSEDDLNQEQMVELLDNRIKIVPKIKIDNSVLTYLIISFDNFAPTSNPEFRDNDIIFDIVCHFDQWQLKDFQLRPFKIAGEIDAMLNNQRLSGIGELEFMTGNFISLNEDYGVLTLMYRAVHGEEDNKGMLNPADEAAFIEEFNEIYNV